MSCTQPTRGTSGCDTQITELALAGPGPRETLTRSAPHYDLPVPRDRQRCLYDHLQRLQELALEAGALDARIDVLDAALARV